eukprot:2339735-Amphidinium_carterae.1
MRLSTSCPCFFEVLHIAIRVSFNNRENKLMNPFFIAMQGRHTAQLCRRVLRLPAQAAQP